MPILLTMGETLARKSLEEGPVPESANGVPTTVEWHREVTSTSSHCTEKLPEEDAPQASDSKTRSVSSHGHQQSA